MPPRARSPGRSERSTSHAQASSRGLRARLLTVLRTLGIVALVMLIVLLAIPLGIGMVIAGLLVLALFGTSTLPRFKPQLSVLLLARSLERPPRFA